MNTIAEKTEKPTSKKKLIKLDIGCGQNKRDGFVGMDMVKLPGVDIVQDAEKTPWPIRDESVEEACISHYAEHVKNLPAFMDELHRVLVPEGRATIVCPYYTSMRSMQDPFHIRPISEATFLYYNADWRKANGLDHYPIKCDFDFSYGYIFYPEWAMRSEDARAFAIRHYNNVASDIQVVLTKKIKK